MAVVDDLGHTGIDVPPPTEDFGRQPPQDEAAEQAVLGGMLLSKDAIADVLERLRPADFYRPNHQNVYDAILDLYGRGEPADAVTVAAELDRRGLLRRIGGAPYLHTLISTVPTAANAGFYAGIVAEKALLRRLVEAGTRVVQYGYAGAEGSDVAEVVDRAQAEIYDVTEGRTSEDFVALEDLLQPTMDEIDAIASNGGLARGVPTGFTELDDVTNGLHPGQMIIVAARPGVGKALALDTPLPTPTGWTTMGDVAVGDWLLGADGQPTLVVAATDVLLGRPCYEIEFSDGSRIVADAQHQWPTGYGIRTSSELRCGLDSIAAAGSLGCYEERRAMATLMAPVVRIDAVRRVRTVPVRCVEVDNAAHLYLAGRGMVPTHNSTLALDFLRSCSIKNRLASVVFSLEMSKSEIVMRLLSAEAKIKLADMRSGRMSDDDWTRLARRMSEISEAPLYIDDSPNLTMMEIRAKARRLKQKADLRLVVVDYMQLMSSGKKFESRQQEVSEFSRSMKLLAKELDLPVVAISQLNRGPEQRTDKKPMLSDLRESGCLTANTRILRADTGAEVTFGELMRTGERPLVWSLDERKRMVARPMTNVFPSGRKEVFKVRLASGREVEATGNHPFMTLDGWNPLERLTVGDRVAVPRRVPEPVHTQRMDESEIILLAHMIGDGSCVKRQPIRYASIDEQNLAAVTTAAQHFGVTAVRDDYA
ncbi:MAG TPA: replicative DNA helicase, partial [Mycobacterium sp.]|nr:replicative DNA helicase [Mycobacterium sp.]